MEKTEKEDEPFGLGCALELFSEAEEVNHMIDDLVNIVNADTSVKEKTYERFSFILGQYFEQPHLLDKHLEGILQKFINIVKDPRSSLELKHQTFKYLYVLVNVRGYKFIVRQLPHEVADFEPVLQLLESQDHTDPETWMTRYVLLLWLSIIVMIPFHMARLDGLTNDDEKSTTKRTVVERVLDIIKKYAIVPDKSRDAAAYLSSRFITRYDVKEEHLSSFLHWAIDLSLANDSNTFVKHGTLASVAMILKHGKREYLLTYASQLLQWIVNDEFKNNTGTNVQKLVYKIVQRIGLILLPPKVAKWRYKRGNRSLGSSLSAGDGKPLTTNQSEDNDDDNDNIEVPDEVEEVIDQLIQGLRNNDGVVRWSAAKGIGRVTGRLPKELADEVVGSILELFNPREGDGAWHGGSLALAELGRRGLLLPQRLPEVVPVVLKALIYDEPRGYSSVGSHIRDAACYVCWSFARAYDTEVLRPFVKSIASILLVVTCFDREINCRRAASAAFQENVGRQGTFPHGIDILTSADFYAVSVRNNSYLTISVFVAAFEEYTLPMIDHLIERKVDHWDCSIRELTSKALHNLTPLAPEYVIDEIVPKLFEKAHTIDLNSRHGSVLALGEIFHALSKIQIEKNSSIENVLSEDILEKVRKLISEFREKLYFRGMGGELMKLACSSFIQNCSLAHMPFHGQDVTEEWLSLLNESLSYDSVPVRMAAIAALPVLLKEYHCTPNSLPRQKQLVSHYLRELLQENSQVSRGGHALALGSLPADFLVPFIRDILQGLSAAAEITPTTLKWAESRRDALKGFTAIVETLEGEIGRALPVSSVQEVYSSLLGGLQDYTQDKRGDIGAWAREASVAGLQSLTLLLARVKPTMLEAEIMSKVMSGIAQQSVEKIDRTRALAAKAFYTLLYSEPRIPNIPNYPELLAIFPKEECDFLNWNSAAATFPKFVQVIRFLTYSYSIMLGIICSIGGLTETLVKHSSAALFGYLHSQPAEEVKRLCDLIEMIGRKHRRQDRIMIALFRFLDRLLGSGTVDGPMKEGGFPSQVLQLVQAEMLGCKDVYKLVDGVNVLCHLIQIPGDVCKTALVQLSILLCHRAVYIRRSTATRLYESLLVYGSVGGLPEESLDKAMEILGDTDWEAPVAELRPLRNNLCGLLGVRVPVSVTKKL